MSADNATRNRMLRWVKSSAAVAALSLVGVLAVAAPASAGSGDCPSGSTCLWKDADYTTGGVGWIYETFSNGIKDLRKYNWDLGHGNINDNVTSAYNNGNKQTSYLFYNLSFQAQLIQPPIKIGARHLGIGNDKATSAGFTFCVTNPSSAMCV